LAICGFAKSGRVLSRDTNRAFALLRHCRVVNNQHRIFAADPETGFSLGTFGTIAEFTRDTGELASFQRSPDSIGTVTARGGLRIDRHPDLRLIASEQPTRDDWSHRLALCLPHAACAMNRRAVLTEIGADAGALRCGDRDAVLFDLGLATLQVDVCIRGADPQVIAALRGAPDGRSLPPTMTRCALFL
jgi:hypothetical protein